MSTKTSKAYEKSGLLDNIIRKLQIYMDYNNQSLHGLATAMGLSYLPLYRMFTKKHLPTINSLEIIADHLGCSASELISERIFFDIKCFDDIDDKLKNTPPKFIIRVFCNYEDFLPLMHKDFFAIIEHNKSNPLIYNEAITNSYYQIFYIVDQFLLDGKYIVEHNSKKKILDILSSSSKYIVIQDKESEKKIDLGLVKPIAKFFNYIEIKDNKIFEGKTK